jgi:hypothetical protein
MVCVWVVSFICTPSTELLAVGINVAVIWTETLMFTVLTVPPHLLWWSVCWSLNTAVCNLLHLWLCAVIYVYLFSKLLVWTLVLNMCVLCANAVVPLYLLIQYLWFQLSTVCLGLKKIGKLNKRFISFKMCAKQEQAVTWWNPAAQTHPVLNSSSFSLLTLELVSILLLAFLLFTLVATLSVFVFRKPIFIN